MKYTVAFYKQDGPGPGDDSPSPTRGTLEMATEGWPDWHRLVATMTMDGFERGPMESQAEVLEAFQDVAERASLWTRLSEFKPSYGPWWLAPNVTLRGSVEAAVNMRPCVEPGDVLAVGEGGNVRRYNVADKLELIEAETVREDSSVYSDHLDEVRLEAQRARLAEHLERRSKGANTTMEKALNSLLNACVGVAHGFTATYGYPIGLLDHTNGACHRFVSLLKDTSNLVSCLPCENLDPGSCQDELRYIAHRAGVLAEFDRATPEGRRIPVYETPPDRSLDMKP